MTHGVLCVLHDNAVETSEVVDVFLTLQQRGRSRHSLWNAVLAVNGLQELWNAVIFIDDNDAHLRGDKQGKERKRVEESVRKCNKSKFHPTDTAVMYSFKLFSDPRLVRFVQFQGLKRYDCCVFLVGCLCCHGNSPGCPKLLSNTMCEATALSLVRNMNMTKQTWSLSSVWGKLMNQCSLT